MADAPATSHAATNDPPPSTSTPKASNQTEPTHDAIAPVDSSALPNEQEDDMLLVSEFPPPPHYFALASRHTPAHLRLTPPEIPLRSFRVAAKKVLGERKRAKEESERIRLAACGDVVGGTAGDGSKTKEEGGGANAATVKEEDDDSIDSNEDVVAVFGEIVEDPTLTVEQECEDPTVIRENVKRLNQDVLRGFLKLVHVLINDPNENKKLRDELSHNLFLMIQECNKFREHQAREILITTLEQQLKQRKEGLDLLKKEIGVAQEALGALHKFCEKS